MAIRSLKNGTFSRSLLVGNSYYIPPAYEWIASATATGGETTLSFSSIPATYKHLQIRLRFNLTGSNNIFARFNGSSSALYIDHRLRGDGSTVSAGSPGAGQTEWLYTSVGYPTSAGNFGYSIIDIHNYANTSQNKTVRVFHGYDTNGADGQQIALTSALWINTAAINSISFTPGAGNSFKANSKIMLFGIKAGA